jgi:hypothetical protein
MSSPLRKGEKEEEEKKRRKRKGKRKREKEEEEEEEEEEGKEKMRKKRRRGGRGRGRGKEEEEEEEEKRKRRGGERRGEEEGKKRKRKRRKEEEKEEEEEEEEEPLCHPATSITVRGGRSLKLATTTKTQRRSPSRTDVLPEVREWCINTPWAPNRCPHGTHTGSPAYTRGTYSRVPTKQNLNRFCWRVGRLLPFDIAKASDVASGSSAANASAATTRARPRLHATEVEQVSSAFERQVTEAEPRLGGFPESHTGRRRPRCYSLRLGEIQRIAPSSTAVTRGSRRAAALLRSPPGRTARSAKLPKYTMDSAQQT